MAYACLSEIVTLVARMKESVLCCSESCSVHIVDNFTCCTNIIIMPSTYTYFISHEDRYFLFFITSCVETVQYFHHYSGNGDFNNQSTNHICDTCYQLTGNNVNESLVRNCSCQHNRAESYCLLLRVVISMRHHICRVVWTFKD